MKRLTLIACSLLFLGAGCFNFGAKSSSNSPDGGVFKSADAGTTWSQVTSVPTAQGMGTLATSDVINLELDPSDALFLYAGTRDNGMVYSEDGALSWKLPRQLALRDGAIFSVEVDPNNPCKVYVAKGSRLFKSTNCLRTFEDEMYVETRPNVFIIQVAVDWYNKGIVWIGLNNGDIFKSTDEGKSWKSVLNIKNMMSEILINNKDSRQMLIASYTDGLQRSIDGGETWMKVQNEVKEFTGAQQVFALSQTASGDAVLAATQYGLLISKDMGASWTGIPLLTAPGQVEIRAAAIAPQNANVLYYATLGTFYRTSDGGQTWETQKIPSTRVPRALVVDPKDSNVVYVGVANPAE